MEPLNTGDRFADRHIGPSPDEVGEMLAAVGVRSLDDLIDQAVPAGIRLKRPLDLPAARSEFEALGDLRRLAERNVVHRSFIGMGYYDTITPPVIQRNILENPGWYTQYTPYQAEISQGRLEALLNFQTMVADLTALPIANASLLDEATAAAEAMHMCYGLAGEDGGRNAFFVADDCHPQTIAVVRTRARALGIEVVVGKPEELAARAEGTKGREQGTGSREQGTGNREQEEGKREKQPTTGAGATTLSNAFGVLLQYPNTYGEIRDYSAIIERVHAAGAKVVVATDLLALALIKPPGEFGADIAVGSAQRFGVPMGYGGPHAAFLSCRDEFKRQMPGRLVGVSKDAHGKPAYRLALATREQHIRREKATSNICTAQVLLAVMASMYAVYHGPEGLREIAWRIHQLAALLHRGLEKLRVEVGTDYFFDTIRVRPRHEQRAVILERARKERMDLRDFGDGSIGITLDETSSFDDVRALWRFFGDEGTTAFNDVYDCVECGAEYDFGPDSRSTSFFSHPVFNTYHSEHEMLRYIKRLEARDLSLTTSMIPLGSCTMKLNAAAEMLPVSWPEFARVHPFAPAEQTAGYQQLFKDLENWLAEITGLPAVSLQPNAGSQGEYAGLLAIRAYHEANAVKGTGNREQGTELKPANSKLQAPNSKLDRDICLIPTSAHGTNPASAVIAGFKVVPVKCDRHGNIDVGDLRAKAAEHAARLGALMVTYPSTHGVFEESIREICDIVHEHGGQVYLDGANMNAQVGLCRPGDYGADVCHLNLHKTFCIPHGGGGPGMGPICAAKHLAPFLPGHPLQNPESEIENDVGPVSAAPYGSPSILTIPWMYIAMMGPDGLTRASEIAILNANYMAARLEQHYPVLYRGVGGRVAHEFILDCRHFEDTAGVKVEDIAKRLMDFGFHAPTMSFPVAGTLMIEPTESESKAELDRLCDALIAIREEIRAIEQGKLPRDDNPLKNAPHTAAAVTSTEWSHPYRREQAAFPAPWLREHKFWPHVGRIDNVWGDRNLFCTCPPVQGE